jgi:tetratricopeptide (TPR) repeat protein
VTRAWTDPRVLAAALFLVTALVFWPATSFEFLAYDDDVYVTNNAFVRAGLTGESLRAAFTSGAAANWHPLTWLSHQLDVALFALEPGPHHRTSVLLHALNAALAFLALRALTQRAVASLLVAALFALHPLRVESVAWIAERKDVLCGTFFFALLWAHAHWARTRRRGAYVLSVALLALGLMAKPMLVTSPAVLLVLDVWPLARRDWRAALLEKLPLVALALLSCVVTYAVQERGGALAALSEVGALARLELALRALVQYVGITLWPTHLTPFHPHPALETSAQLVALPLAALVAGALASSAWFLRRRAPAVPAGLALFVGMLVPVLGLVSVGLAGWAERYTYLPSLGLGLALVFGVGALVPARAQRGAALVCVLGLVGLTGVTARTLPHWRDDRALFSHAVAVEPSSVAHVQLGNALERAGEPEAALRELAAALARRPELAGARVNRARLLLALERPDEARAELRAAAATPGVDETTVSLVAWVLATSAGAGDPELARGLALELTRRSPGQLAHRETLAAAEARLGNTAEAARLQAELLPRLPASARAAAEERLALYRAGKPFLTAP